MRLRDERGFGLLEILIVLVVGALTLALLHGYLATTGGEGEARVAASVNTAALAADETSLAAIRSALGAYHAEHGRWPADRSAVIALLPSPPLFRCAGNDFEYDPATGHVRLRVADAARC